GLDGVRHIFNAGGCKDVAAGRRTIKIKGIEGRDFAEVCCRLLQRIIHKTGETIIFEVEYKERHSALDGLPNELFENIPCLARSRRAHYQSAAANVQIDDVLTPLILEPVTAAEMKEVWVGQLAFLLGKAFVVLVEYASYRRPGQEAGERLDAG